MAENLNRRAFLTGVGGLAAATLLPGFGAETPPIKGMVLGQPKAAAAGNAMLATGGNAVDAIVTAALVAGVVAVPSTGIGGYGGHLVIAGLPKGKVIAIDFNTTAPAALKADFFGANEKGEVKGNVNTYGWLAAGVPGVLAGLQLALDRFGTRRFAEVVRPAIKQARDGFPVAKSLATNLKTARVRLAKDPGSVKLFFDKGEPLAENATYRNPALADLLEKLAERGSVATFYKGDIADTIAAAFKKNGGLVTGDDLAAYRAVEVAPLSFDWNGFTMHTPPPTSGGLTVLQTLAILKALNWTGEKPADSLMYLEALRLAWTDRFKFIGDPKQVEVPMNKMLSNDYARELAERVRIAVKNKKPVDGQSDGRSAGGTIHLNAVDSSGLTVALTLTHGGGLGAQVTVDELGLVLGHGMSRFDPRPGHPNSPGPGKRPLHNMCPTIVTKDGQLQLTVGATGGRRIVNSLAAFLAYRIGRGLPLADAVKQPRVHTEGDLAVIVEDGFPAIDALKTLGYAISKGQVATLNAIEREPKAGELRSAAR